MKRFTLLLLLLATRAAFADAPVGAVATIDKPAAIVGKMIIWASEVDVRIEAGKLQNQPLDRATALEGLIDERLLLARAKQLRIEVGTQEIDQAVEQIKSQNKVDDKQLDEMLAKIHMTRDGYKKELANQILLLKLANYEWRGRIKVTDDEVSAAGKQHGIPFPTDDQKKALENEVYGAKIDAAQRAWLVERKKLAHITRRP